MGLMRLLPRPNVRAHTATEEKSLQRVIVFANQKGGVAKTTTTLNLAVAFKEQGFRVLVVDLDPQGNLTMSQGMNPDSIERSMFDVLVHRLPISEIIHTAEVDVAVSSIDLAGAELALSSMIGRERALEKALVEVRDSYDFIMVDTPPSFTQQTLAAIDTADGACVIAEPHVASMKAGRDCLDVLDKLSFPKERTLLVINRTTQAGLETDEVSRFFNRRPDIVVPFTPAFDDAADRGRPIVVLHPDNAASKQLRDLAARLTVLAPAGR